MPSVDEAKAWLRAMGDKGLYGGAAARLRVSAVDQLLSVLGPEESRDAQTVLDNLETITRRWATKHQANPATANTYQSRVRSSLADFIAYQEDPTRFPKTRTMISRSSNAAPRGTKPAPNARGDGLGSPERPVPHREDEQSFVFSLSDGKRAHLMVPMKLSKRDIQIIKKQIELLELQAQA